MAIVTGNEYDHVDFTKNNITTRHALKDTTARGMVGDIVKISDSDPQLANNKIWIKETPESEVLVPTMAEFNVLDGDVEDLKGAINEYLFQVNKFPNNLVDISSCIDSKQISTADGSVMNGPGYFITGYIEVTAGTEYKANCGRNLAWYKSDKTFLSSPGNGTQVQSGVTAPTNAVYIRFTVSKASDTPDPYGLYFSTSSNYNPTITLPNNVKSNNFPSMYDNNGTLLNPTLLQNVIGVTKFPGNLVDPTDWNDNKYVIYNSGELSDSSAYFATGYIPVTAGTTYKANKGRNLSWYKSDKTFISGVSGTTIQTGVTAPTNAAYIRFSINKSSDGISNPLLLYFAKSSDYSLNVTIDGLVATDTIPWCYGKKINWIGDSIVAGDDFDEVVCSNLGLIQSAEYGINGSTIALASDGSDGRNAVCARFSNMSDDTDIVAVSAGTNDFQYAWCPIGTIDSADDGTANNTFYGALKYLCKGLITKYPQKLIFFTTPIKRAQAFESGNGGTYTPDGQMTTPWSKNKYGLTLGDYADIIKEVCGYYSIPVIDMYRESLLNPHITAQQDMFDNVYTHPTSVGRKIMARRICGWLTQIGYTIG